MPVPVEVRRLLETWQAGALVLGELVMELLRSLTNENVNEVMDAVPSEVFAALVARGCSAPRPGEPVLRMMFGTAAGPVDLGPPVATEDDWSSASIAAFDRWYRDRYRREATGAVNRGMQELTYQLQVGVEAGDLSRESYDGALRIAQDLIPHEAPDRDALFESVRQYEKWIGVGPAR